MRLTEINDKIIFNFLSEKKITNKVADMRRIIGRGKA